jgi:hypothetical protein
MPCPAQQRLPRRAAQARTGLAKPGLDCLATPSRTLPGPGRATAAVPYRAEPSLAHPGHANPALTSRAKTRRPLPRRPCQALASLARPCLDGHAVRAGISRARPCQDLPSAPAGPSEPSLALPSEPGLPGLARPRRAKPRSPCLPAPPRLALPGRAVQGQSGRAEQGRAERCHAAPHCAMTAQPGRSKPSTRCHAKTAQPCRAKPSLGMPRDNCRAGPTRAPSRRAARWLPGWATPCQAIRTRTRRDCRAELCRVLPVPAGPGHAYPARPHLAEPLLAVPS